MFLNFSIIYILKDLGKKYFVIFLQIDIFNVMFFFYKNSTSNLFITNIVLFTLMFIKLSMKVVFLYNSIIIQCMI